MATRKRNHVPAETSANPTAESVPATRSDPPDLQRRMELAHQIVQASPAFVAVVTPEGRTIMMNEAMLDALGYTAEEVAGTDYLETFVPASDRAELREVLATIARQRTSAINEHHVLARDGRQLLVEWHDQPVYDAAGEVEYFFGVGLDITRRRMTEVALRESEERFRLLAENVPGVIYLCRNDARYTMLYLNDKVETLTGYPKNEFLEDRLSFYDLYHPDDAPLIAPIVDLALAKNQPYRLVYRLRRRSGDWRWIDEVGVALKREGEPDLLEGFLIDITEQRNTETAMIESELRHRTILDYMQEAVIYADENNVVRHINTFACQLLGATREATVGRELIQMHNEPISSRVFEIVRLFRENPNHEVVTRRRSLRSRELIFRFSPARDSEGRYRGIITNIIDITEQVTMQRQLAEARRMEAVGTLAGGVAHDFNNLMTTVLGLASHMKNRCPDGHPDRERLSQIEQSATTAGQLAHQLLTFAKGGKFKTQTLDTDDIIDRALMTLKPAVPSKVTVRRNALPGIVTVECDSTQVEQVIVNLCRNAIDAMPNGGLLTITRDQVVLNSPRSDTRPRLAPGTYVRVTITDTGAGIDAETAERIFDPFFSTKPGGYGLGLASAYGIMRAHLGGISLETEIDKGSSFTIWLPAAVARNYAH